MARIGIGTEFRRWNSNTSAWEQLTEIQSISGPSATRSTLDTTTLDTAGGYATFIPGLRDAGTIKCSLNFTRESYDLMKSDYESDDPHDYEIVLPDEENTTFEFSGYVTEIPLNIPKDVITFEASIKISGPVTVNSGSGA